MNGYRPVCGPVSSPDQTPATSFEAHCRHDIPAHVPQADGGGGDRLPGGGVFRPLAAQRPGGDARYALRPADEGPRAAASHHRHPRPAASGLLPRAERQPRPRGGRGQASAPGRPGAARERGNPGRQHRGLRVHLPGFRGGCPQVRKDGRSGQSCEPLPQPEGAGRRRGPDPDAGRRGPVAGIGHVPVDPGPRHGRGVQPSRHRRHDRALGVHLPRGRDPVQHPGVQRRVRGPERAHQGGQPVRGRLFRDGRAARRPRPLRRGQRDPVQAVRGARDRRTPRGGGRAGVPPDGQRESAGVHPGLDVRDTGGRADRTGRPGARRGGAGCRDPAVPQRDGRGSQAGVAGRRDRRDTGRPHPRRHPGAGRGRDPERGELPGHQRGNQRKIRGRPGHRVRGRTGRGNGLSSSAGVRRVARGRSGHGGAGVRDPLALLRRVGRRMPGAGLPGASGPAGQAV